MPTALYQTKREPVGAAGGTGTCRLHRVCAPRDFVLIIPVRVKKKKKGTRMERLMGGILSLGDGRRANLFVYGHWFAVQ